MSSQIQAQIEEILQKQDPIDALRQFVIKLNTDGISKEEILREFSELHSVLQKNNRERDADIVGDVIDMITGWYKGKDLELK